jgi:hypothetical protein
MDPRGMQFAMEQMVRGRMGAVLGPPQALELTMLILSAGQDDAGAGAAQAASGGQVQRLHRWGVTVGRAPVEHQDARQRPAGAPATEVGPH